MNEIKTKESLGAVARKIEHHAKKSDEHVIAAAILVREARQRVEAGEGNGLTWFEWARKNIQLSDSRLHELQRIAEADDPVKELERQRKLNRKRAKKHREKNAAEKAASRKNSLGPERKRLIDWAKSAPIEAVRRILDQIASNDNVAGSRGETSSVEGQDAA